MPPRPLQAKPNNYFNGKIKPFQNQPTIYGSLSANRQTLNPKPTTPPQTPSHFPLQKWYPDAQNAQNAQNSLQSSDPNTASNNFYHTGRKLSPISRYILDSFRKHRYWGPNVIADLNRLRRVYPNWVAEVIKTLDDVGVCSKFFHWAGKQKGYQHTYKSYNAYMFALYRLNKYRAAEQVPELMKMQGRGPSEQQFEVLIRLHADNGRGLRVHYIYDMMKKFGVKPRVFLYNKIMKALVKTGHLGLALSVYDDFKKAGLVEETVTYMILIKGLGQSGRIHEMLEMLRRMRQLCNPDVFAYTAIIQILVDEGNLDGCLRVWDEMKIDRVEPDAMAYTTLISALCKGNRVEESYKFFEGLKKKGALIDRAVYGSLVEGFVADGKVGSALDLLEDMMGSGYRADLSIYNTLIEGFCNIKQLDKAFKLFQVTIKEGLQPDFKTVNPMLEAYAESREMDKFCRLLDHMDKLGENVLDGLSSFFSLMVERENSSPLTLTVFEDLKTRGYSSIPIYNVILGALYKSGQTKAAMSLFNGIKDSNLTPDSTTYSHAIMCLVDLGDMKEACSWYNRIKALDSVPSIEAYRALVKGLCKKREIDAAILLVQDCLANVTSGPMEFKYTLTIIHECRSNDAEKVLEVLDEMIEEGYVLDEIVYCAVISGMCKRGTIEEGKKVFSSMRERTLLTEANEILYNDMLVEHMKKKTTDLVMSGLKFFGRKAKSELELKNCWLLSS